jgi:hypothetical protein
MLGVKLYSKRNGVPVTKDALDDKIRCLAVDKIVDVFFEPLRSGSAFSFSENEMKKRRASDRNYMVLNRHEILHGSDVAYGNEVNSLKAISQLEYLACVKKFLEHREKSVA